MRFTVNGEEHSVACPRHVTLLTVLRDHLQLTGTKLGCGRGECGACTVHVDGRLAYACLTLAASCEGQRITTVEGLSQNGALDPMQQAFIAADALQCGFCTPGQLMAARVLLDRCPDPSDAEIRSAMSGNLCRCGTYPKIVKAIQAAATAAAGASANVG